jgi:DNA repair protein RecO (recombination protein O)
MDWTEDGILLTLRPHGETSAVASLLTRDHGRHTGLIRGATGKRARGSLLQGSVLRITWRARLAEQLGTFAWELLTGHGGAWLDDPARLAVLSSACALAEATLPDREPHPNVFNALGMLLDSFEGPSWPSLYAQWELCLLADLGYGLDLSSCAATGRNDDLAYVSPRSGRAVSLSAGEPYRDKLLRLPNFLRDQAEDLGPVGRADLSDALALTGYFLDHWVLGPVGRTIPPARTRLVERMRA